MICDGVAEQLGLALHPQLVDPVRRELALASAAGVHEMLEAVHGHLAEHRGDGAVDALGQQPEALAIRLVAASSRSNTSVSPNTDAVSANVSGVDW